MATKTKAITDRKLLALTDYLIRVLDRELKAKRKPRRRRA